MCMLCVEFQKGRMNIREAKSALTELVRGVKMDNENFWHLTDLDETKTEDEFTKLMKEYKE